MLWCFFSPVWSVLILLIITSNVLMKRSEGRILCMNEREHSDPGCEPFVVQATS